jgi:glycosyltransferase involved in cell wall biosynthesis
LPEKSGDPTVLFLGRLDGEKKPEEFMQLAERFPDVKFIAAGASHDPEYDRMLRR